MSSARFRGLWSMNITELSIEHDSVEMKKKPDVQINERDS